MKHEDYYKLNQIDRIEMEVLKTRNETELNQTQTVFYLLAIFAAMGAMLVAILHYVQHGFLTENVIFSCSLMIVLSFSIFMVAIWAIPIAKGYREDAIEADYLEIIAKPKRRR
jgi:hypothetical protein